MSKLNPSLEPAPEVADERLAGGSNPVIPAIFLIRLEAGKDVSHQESQSKVSFTEWEIPEPGMCIYYQEQLETSQCYKEVMWCMEYA